MSPRSLPLVALVSGLTLATPALAQADTLAAGPSAWRAALGLLLVIGLILLCGWAARRLGVAGRVSAGMPTKLVGSMSLGPRERIVVLEVDGTWLVVGVTPGGMRTLHTLPAAPDTTVPVAGAGVGPALWRDVLQRAVGRTRTP